jgi:predicted ATPase
LRSAWPNRAGANYRDGVWFVGFAEISDADVIVPTICQSLDFAKQPDVGSMTGLKDWLARRQLLLVLDNVEQLGEGTIVVGELLAACPEVTMLVTSREPLHPRWGAPI